MSVAFVVGWVESNSSVEMKAAFVVDESYLFVEMTDVMAEDCSVAFVEERNTSAGDLNAFAVEQFALNLPVEIGVAFVENNYLSVETEAAFAENWVASYSPAVTVNAKMPAENWTASPVVVLADGRFSSFLPVPDLVAVRYRFAE